MFQRGETGSQLAGGGQGSITTNHPDETVRVGSSTVCNDKDFGDTDRPLTEVDLDEDVEPRPGLEFPETQRWDPNSTCSRRVDSLPTPSSPS